MESMTAKNKHIHQLHTNAFSILLEQLTLNVNDVSNHHVIQVLLEKHVSVEEVVIEEVKETNVVEFFDNI